jgi:phage tail-like protein
MLPAHVRRSDERGELGRFIGCLQVATDQLLAEQDRWLDILDLRWAPEAYVDLILADLGNPFPFALDVMSKRRLAAALFTMYRLKGTAVGIELALRFFVAATVRVLPRMARGARLGRARLNRDFWLGSSARAWRYSFDLEVDRVLSDEERRQVRWLAEYAKPAHTHLINLIEPVPPTVPTMWRLGRSRLARTTRLAQA